MAFLSVRREGHRDLKTTDGAGRCGVAERWWVGERSRRSLGFRNGPMPVRLGKSPFESRACVQFASHPLTRSTSCALLEEIFNCSWMELPVVFRPLECAEENVPVCFGTSVFCLAASQTPIFSFGFFNRARMMWNLANNFPLLIFHTSTYFIEAISSRSAIVEK